jgi:hypothetical protein
MKIPSQNVVVSRGCIQSYSVRLSSGFLLAQGLLGDYVESISSGKAADSSIARPDVIGLVNTLRSDGHEVMANRVDVVF